MGRKKKNVEVDNISNENESDVYDDNLLDIELDSIDEENELDIDDVDYDFNNCEVDCDYDKKFRLKTNRHKIEGTHALKRDILSKGKLVVQEEVIEDQYLLDNEEVVDFNKKIDSCKIEEDYEFNRLLKIDVHNIITNKTDVNISRDKQRRMPHKEIFNSCFNILVDSLKHKYSRCELLVELSGYFTDELSNAYKNLDKENALEIIKELKNKKYLTFLDDVKILK